MGSHRKQTRQKKKSNGLIRPKRPITGYNLFISKFMKSKVVKSTQDARKAIKEGASEWKKLSVTEKNKYDAQSYRDRCRYAEEIEEYRQELKAMKCPRNSYVAFLRDYCMGQFGNLPFKLGFRQIAILSRAASNVWKGLTNWRKQDYKNEFKKYVAQHKQCLKENKERRQVKGQRKRQWNDQEEDEEEEEEMEEEKEEETSGNIERYNINHFQQFTRPFHDRSLDQFGVKNSKRVDMEIEEEEEEEEEKEEDQGWKSKLRKRINPPVYYPNTRSQGTKGSSNSR